MSNPRRLPIGRRLLAASLVVLGLVFFAAAASAKGPIEASVDGPGLEDPILFGGWDAEAPLAEGAPLMEFAEAAGFFAGVFERQPDPMLARRPKGDLGPRYVIAYLVPGGYDEEWRIVQDLYPYAKPNPVTYMAPGQRIYHTQTRGGWFVATSPAVPPLLFMLTEAGLPQNPPSAGDGSPFPWRIVGSAAAIVAALAVGTLAIVVVRRRPHPAA